MKDFEALTIQVEYTKNYFAEIVRIDLSKTSNSPTALQDALDTLERIPVGSVNKYVVINDKKHHVQEINLHLSLRTTEHTYVQMNINFGDARSWRFLIRHFYLQMMGYSVSAKGVN